MKIAAVWVTRPEPGNANTTAYVRSAGFPVVAVPVLEVSYVNPELRLEAWPDWVLFVSGRAVRGLEQGLRGSGLPQDGRSGVRAAAVGSRSALEAAGHGWNVELVPSSENAEGLLELLNRTDMRGRRVWIPAGNREGSARGVLSETLRKRGADVVLFSVYETRDRVLTAEDEARLNDAEPGAIVFHSPSAVEAVFANGAPVAMRRWLSAELAAIGPSTAARAREMGLDCVLEASEPSDQALVSLLVSLGKWERAALGDLERKRV